MAQQQARDEAGNIWNIDEAGNPVSLASPAPQQGGGSVVAPNPVQAQRQSVDLQGAGLGNKKTAQQIALEAAKVPYAPRQAAADTSKAEAEAAAASLALQKAQREAQLPVSGQVGRVNLQRAIDDIKAKFAAGPGRTSGIGGLQDYLPTTENQQFDAAGNSVRGFVGPALGLTGGQLNTEKEAQRAVGPYIPQSGDRDAVIQDKIRRLQGLADAMGGARRQGQQTQQSQGAIIPGAGTTPQTPNGPEGYNVGTTGGGVSGGSGGGSNFASAAGVAMSKKLSEAYTKGAGVQELNRLLSDNGFQTFSDPATIAAIAKRGRLNFAPPVADDTRGGVGKALGSLADSAGGAYAINAADALTAGTLDNIAGGQSKMAIDYSQQQYPGASLVGTVTGGALAAGGAELGLARAGLGAGAAALGGDALYGAAYGAGSADGPDQSRALGALGGGVGGLAGAAAGRGLARGAGNLLRGVQDPSVQLLRARGVPTTVGQAVSQSGRLGAAIKTAEDLTTGLPGLGTMTNARRLEGFEGFNQAGFDEGLAPIMPGLKPGKSTGGVIREQGVDIARGARSQAYSDALDPVNLQIDQPFIGDYDGAVQAGRDLPEDLAGRADFTLKRGFENFDNTGNLTGDGFQQGIRRFRREAGNNAPLPNGSDFGEVMQQGEGAFEGLLNRQSPGTLPAYNAANKANRNVEILRAAVNAARTGTRVGEPGVFAPSQLTDAVAANAKKYGNSHGTTNQPFYDLTRAGQKVLTSKVADSGTAGRAALTAGLATLGVGGTGYAANGAEGAGYGTLGLAAALGLGGSKVAQRAAVKLLLDRPEFAIRAGNGIANRARIGGLFGAPMLAGAGSQLATQ
jgi:hypothetical protein